MSQQENVTPTIVAVRFQIQRNPLLDGTSADTRFLAGIENSSTMESSVVFEFLSEQEEEYQPFVKPSAIIEELQGHSA